MVNSALASIVCRFLFQVLILLILWSGIGNPLDTNFNLRKSVILLDLLILVFSFRLLNRLWNHPLCWYCYAYIYPQFTLLLLILPLWFLLNQIKIFSTALLIQWLYTEIDFVSIANNTYSFFKIWILFDKWMKIFYNSVLFT